MFDKTPLETTLDDRLPAGLGGRCYGVYPALVSDVSDPDGHPGVVDIEVSAHPGEGPVPASPLA